MWRRSACVASSETYEHIGVVPVWVHDLERRWQEEESRTRVIVDEGAGVLRWIAMPTSAPPQVALGVRDRTGSTDPLAARRDGGEVIAVGNRRGVGATNHCMHGNGREHRRAARLAALRLLHLPQHRPDAIGADPLPRTTEFEPTRPTGRPAPAIRSAQDGQGAGRHGADGPVAR